jgi:predicted Zn-ribbon and HTH transcriptional regulator
MVSLGTQQHTLIPIEIPNRHILLHVSKVSKKINKKPPKLLMFPNRFHSLGFYVPKDPLKVTIFCKWASFDGGTI